jgi:hypothetical protein
MMGFWQGFGLVAISGASAQHRGVVEQASILVPGAHQYIPKLKHRNVAASASASWRDQAFVTL